MTKFKYLAKKLILSFLNIVKLEKLTNEDLKIISKGK
mgnify:CR=1 FL=1